MADRSCCREPAPRSFANPFPKGSNWSDLGLHRLRGIERPERVYQLKIVGLRSQFPPLQSMDAFPGNLPVGEPSFARGDEEFAGRRGELDRLERAWARAGSGVRQVALVAGEPGMGKTRLVGELASGVYAQDGAVLYGRCDEDTVIPYQPFVEALRPYVAAYPTSSLHERLRGLEQVLTRLFPELHGRVAEESPPTSSDLEADRYRLFEAITALLTGIAMAGPTLLVIDDLHWADKPTLLLLRHVIRYAPEAALFTVACYRDVELLANQDVARLLADLRREPFAEQVTLQGLSEAEAEVLLRGIAGQEVAPALTRTLHLETGGNPFFLAELVRSLMETGAGSLSHTDDGTAVDLADLELPEGVRDVVARRVHRLPPPVSETLRLAAVAGPEFGVPLLARAGRQSVDDILKSLDQAKNAGLVHERPGQPGSYAFSHALIRQALYTELGIAAKARLHADVGAALEQEIGLERMAAALAQHYMQALPLGVAPKALEYTTKAGHDAVADLAFEDAASHFERALALHNRHAAADPIGRVELLIDLAGALVFVDEAAGVRAALEAVDAARAHGSPEQFGRAVAVFAEPASTVLSHPDRVAALLDEAQDALGDDHPSLKARLMAFQAFKYSAYQLQGRDGGALAVQAVRRARDAADPLALAEALHARAVSLEGTVDTEERRALGEQLVELGRAAGGRAATATAYGLRVLAGVHLELGDAKSMTSTIRELGRIGEELRWLPALVYEAQWRATQALLEGRFDDVGVCWRDMRRFARAYRAVGGMEAQQGYYLARERGELGDVVGLLEQLATERPNNLLPAMLALAQLDSGATGAAGHTLDSLATADFRAGETESGWGATLGMLAEVAVAAGTPSDASALYELLCPFEGRLLATVIGLACVGAADRYLGMLSTRLERWDDASAHFDRALAMEEQIRGHALVPRTRYWQASFLRDRRAPGDEATADAILEDVIGDAGRLGMERLSEQAEQLRAG